MKKNRSFRKYANLTVLVMFVFSSVIGFVLLAKPAQAQFGIPQVVTDPFVGANTSAIAASGAASLAQQSVRTSIKVKESTWDIVKRAFVNTATLAVLNASNYFMQKLAYDAAIYISSGGKGQGPLFEADSLGEHLKNTAADAAGEAIGTISKEGGFERLGINLCNPSNPRVALNIKLGFLQALPNQLGGSISSRQPRPTCDWRSIDDNWTEFSNSANDQFFDQVGVMFTPGQSTLSAALEFNAYSTELINKKRQDAINNSIIGRGFKNLTTYVSGKVKTPADTIRTEMNRVNKDAAESPRRTADMFTWGAIQEGAFGILPAALQTFVGTLGQEIMKKVFDKGLIAFGDGEQPVDLLAFDASPSVGGRAAAELANASLLTPKIISTSNHDELTQFATCPLEGRSTDNCVMDQRFFNGVGRASQGEPMTVAQAIDQGFLHAEWRLLPSSHPDNLSPNCYQNAYCYSNLKKLRRARIIPIGWELAANSPQNDPANPVTLQEVVDAFNRCPVDGDGNFDATKLPDPLNPWCHLIDPNWVLKYPEAICRQEAAGPTLLSPVGDVRGRACVDSASCVLQDANGNCIGGYGYCVSEKNFWRVEADACPAYAATCQNMRRTVDGKRFSYLMNTTQVDVCGEDNAGCRQYGLTQNLVSNGGFEELFGGEPRNWTVVGGGLDRSGLNSLRGMNGLRLTSIGSTRQEIVSVLPGNAYTFSGSAIAEDSASSGATVTVSVVFRDRAGATLDSIQTDCDLNLAETEASFTISTTDLGYLTGGCSVTAPGEAVSAELGIQAAGGNVYVDEIGVVGEAYSFEPHDTIFLNGKTENCPSGDGGCTRMMRASTGTLNLVRNPSFEARDDSDTQPRFWLTGPGEYLSDAAESLDGFSFVSLSGSAITQTIDGFVPSANYALSAASRRSGSIDEPVGELRLKMFDADGNPTAPQTTSNECTLEVDGLSMLLASGENYERAACQFTTPANIGEVRIEMLKVFGTDDLYVDTVQVELAAQATEYHEGYDINTQEVYLKVAPRGLNCTGSPADPQACSQYAPSCRRDEVGCNLYTPRDGGTSVPAVTTASDFCPQECSGYDTFREEESEFKDSRFPLFFIPSTGGFCTAAEAGCEEFTNLEQLSGGGESTEYFSELRLCTDPNEQTGTFYTWEGSEVEGFQLRVWNLMESNLVSAATGDFGTDPTGGTGPCTNLEYDSLGNPQCVDDDVAGNIASCTKAEIIFNPDCREFYDTEGNIHYRYFSKTILATEACTEYRITESTEDECRNHGGLWTGLECHYFGVGSESRSCRAAAAGCRAYTGNAARNVRILIDDTFEGGTTDEWFATPNGGPTTTVENSNESVTAGGHSLKATSAAIHKDVSSLISRDKSYVLTFWAKGVGDIDIRFSGAADQPFTYNRISETDTPISLSTEWRAFTVGPVETVREPNFDLADASLNEQLTFSISGGGTAQLFVDNINLKEVTESIYVIKDTWETPVSCDQTQNGVTAPQFMLGCREYTDKDDTEVYLKSFNRLCSESAVGCEALYDTHNSSSPFSEAYNAVCSLASACSPSGGETSCSCEIDGFSVCRVSPGSTTCQYDTDLGIDERLIADGGNISPAGDTVVVPDDEIKYLVVDERYECSANNIGCTEVGLPEFNQDGDVVTSWETRYVKNLPDTYSTTLCTEQENFCQAYTRDIDGAPVYLKDPLNHTCEYRENVVFEGFTVSGWFKNGLNEPCYENYREAGNLFGIWKNSDTDYEGWVGTCNQQYDQCKEFIDPLDTSEAHPEGLPYYFIKNSRLDAASCSGQVSLTTSPRSAQDASACVLFDQTDDLNKTFDAAASYEQSDSENGALVAAVSSATNDGNIIIRVKRDRRCGEWLDCRTSEVVFNPSAGEFQNVCTSFGVCNRFERSGDSTQCVSYTNQSHSGSVLTPETYQSRETGYQGKEFAGYSIPNQYPVNELVTIDVADDGPSAFDHVPDLRLVYSLGRSLCNGADYGDPCGDPNNLGNTGSCLGPAGSRHCAYPINGSRSFLGGGDLDLSVWKGRYVPTSCRAYPQEDSPFPSQVADPEGWNTGTSNLNNGNSVLISPSPSFAGANVCQRRIDPITKEEYDSCECSYQIAHYGGSEQRYFSLQDASLPGGYCMGGSFEGYECDPRAEGARSESNLSCCSTSESGSIFNTSCSDGSRCAPLNKIDRVVGYEGQCLERDLTTPINGSFDEFACSTWRPVGIVGGTRDIYNLYQTAGYFAPQDRRFFCSGTQKESILRMEINESCGGEEDCPTKQMTAQWFGRGTVVNGSSTARSQGFNCQSDASGESGAWCLWPGMSTVIDVPKTNSDGDPIPCEQPDGTEDAEDCRTFTQTPLHQTPTVAVGTCKGTKINSDGDVIEPGHCIEPYNVYNLQESAIGILGCYEVDAGGSITSTYIDYPYIGPPIYKEQLKHIYFQVSEDIYDRSDPSEDKINLPSGGTIPENLASATNPWQKVYQDCNDEGDDNIDNEKDDNSDATRATDGQLIKFESGQASLRGYFVLKESTDWQVDPSDGQGAILLRADFDSFGRLTNIRVAASDRSDEGAFGLKEMGFVFKKGCEHVARIDVPGEFGLTRAVTDSVNPYADYSGNGSYLTLNEDRDGDGVNEEYEVRKYESACLPFGGIGNISSNPSFAPWSYVTTHNVDVRQCTGDAFLKASEYGDTRDLASDVSDTLRQLFRSVEQVWRFQGFAVPTGTVVQPPRTQETLYGAQNDKGFDDTDFLGVAGNIPLPQTDDGRQLVNAYRSPRIASVSVENCSGDTCSAGTLGTITLNGREEGVITAQNGVLKAIASFYGWADHNAMPILRRTMIWGDFVPSEAPGKGWYKNQKPYCSAGVDPNRGVGECTGIRGLTCIEDADCPGASTCDLDEPNHFGNTPGACRNIPFEFQHTYVCGVNELNVMDECTGPEDAAENAPCRRTIEGSPFCVYRPGAQIVDNWGWCNCTGEDCEVPGGQNSDGAGCGLGDATPTATPWTPFRGEVRIAPTLEDADAFLSGTGGVSIPPWLIGGFFTGGGLFLSL